MNILTRSAIAAPVRRLALLALFIGAPLRVSGVARPACAGSEQRTFAASDEAIKALSEATRNSTDRTALHDLFGPSVDELLTGDAIQDSADFREISTAMSQRCTPTPEGDDRIVLTIGADRWPFPIPLERKEGRWHFNTEAGKEEMINRHVGGDEHNAIAVCRAYVEAQREYVLEDHDGNGILDYAQRFRSDGGKRDGLYWESKENEPLSPFGPLVADAQAEGYSEKPLSKSRRPFHGYFFRILKAQGPAAPGGAYSYIINDNMVAGFALVAYPARWGESGVMSFIVNQQGKVYQRNLGVETLKVAGEMSAYSPDAGWTSVPERDSAGK